MHAGMLAVVIVVYVCVYVCVFALCGHWKSGES